MTMRKVAQRIPFTPSRTQAALLERCFGDRRFAYNQQVEAFNTYDKETNPNPEYPNVTGMKNANGWLEDSPIPSNALSNAIMDFRKAQSAYFRKAQYEKNRPRFASKNNNIQSFRNTMPIRRMDGNRYPLSRKLGSVRIRKRATNRSILRNGWSGLVGKLSYKAEWYGRTLVQVDRFYPSSKLCHDCGHKYKGLQLSEREWTCENCHIRHDRDVNAALNIRDEALRLSQEEA